MIDVAGTRAMYLAGNNPLPVTQAQGADFQAAVQGSGGSSRFDDFDSLAASKPGLPEMIQSGNVSMNSKDMKQAYAELTKHFSHDQIAAMTPDQVMTAMGISSSGVPSADERAPPGMTVKDIRNMAQGLLANAGNQHIKGMDGKDGYLDAIAKQMGGKGIGDLDKDNGDPDVAWRTLKTLEAANVAPAADGANVPYGALKGGHVRGFKVEGKHLDVEALAGSPAELLKAQLETGAMPATLSKTDGKNVNKFGENTSKAHQIGVDIKHVFEGIGHGIKHLFEGIGQGLNDLFHGHIGKAFGDVVKGATSAVQDVVKPTTELFGDVAELVPFVGKALGANIKGIGEGASSLLGGVGDAAVSIGKGNFGDAARDFTKGTQQAFKDVSQPLLHTVSNIVNEVPGIRDTRFAKDIQVGSDWIANKASGLYNGVSNFVAAPFANGGDTVSHVMRGEWDEAAHSAFETVKSGGELALMAAPIVLTAGAAAPAVAAATGFARAGATMAMNGARTGMTRLGMGGAELGGAAAGRAAQSAFQAGKKAFQANKGMLYKGYVGASAYTAYNHLTKNTDFADGTRAEGSRLNQFSLRNIYGHLRDSSPVPA